jgi:NitT/TauT family transport system ATP-binding protein
LKQKNEAGFYTSPAINPEVFTHFQELARDRAEEKVRAIPVIEARNVVKRYGEYTVIPDLTFTVPDIEGKSEVIAMLGPSGCGKSTILQLIAGLTLPTAGEMFAFGRKVLGPSQNRGMIFQKYSSFPFLTVIDNIAYPLIHVKKMRRKAAYEQARHWLEKMYLVGAENKYPFELSGGMQQRVAIARTLSMNASIILMDEPFGALDRKIRWEMQDLLAELAFLDSETELTFILVTHDIPEAVYLGDRIWIVDKGQIVQTELMSRPREPARVAQSRKEFLDVVSYLSERIDSLLIGETVRGKA